MRGGRIVDSRGREVLLRGVNVNSLAQYWRGRRASARSSRLRARTRDGWPRSAGTRCGCSCRGRAIEPEPGRYDRGYLDLVAATVRRLSRHGIYTIVDLHQDAWGPAAGRPAGRGLRAAHAPGRRLGRRTRMGDARRWRRALLPAGHARAEPGRQGCLAGLLHGRRGTRGSGHPDALRANAAAGRAALRPLHRRGGLRPDERAQRDRASAAGGPLRLLRARARSDPRRRAGRARAAPPRAVRALRALVGVRQRRSARLRPRPRRGLRAAHLHGRVHERSDPARRLRHRPRCEARRLRRRARAVRRVGHRSAPRRQAATATSSATRRSRTRSV